MLIYIIMHINMDYPEDTHIEYFCRKKHEAIEYIMKIMDFSHEKFPLIFDGTKYENYHDMYTSIDKYDRIWMRNPMSYYQISDHQLEFTE